MDGGTTSDGIRPTYAPVDRQFHTGQPGFVQRLEGYMGLANAQAMKLAGIPKKTSDVAGGVIAPDRDGNPTGVFKDAAMALIQKAASPLSGQPLRKAVEAALKYAAQNGVTSVQAMTVSRTSGESLSDGGAERRLRRAQGTEKPRLQRSALSRARLHISNTRVEMTIFDGKIIYQRRWGGPSPG